jgi:hypothetical protein
MIFLPIRGLGELVERVSLLGEELVVGRRSSSGR